MRGLAHTQLALRHKNQKNVEDLEQMKKVRMDCKITVTWMAEMKKQQETG